MNRRLQRLGAIVAAMLVLGGCSQSYRECATAYRVDYRAKHGVSPTQAQVDNACRDRSGNGYYYGSGSRGSKRGGSYSSGGK